MAAGEFAWDESFPDGAPYRHVPRFTTPLGRVPRERFVVPGVRPANGDAADQKRVVTPRAALDAGASVLVVGRPITQAEDPDAAARAIEATL